MRSNLRMAQWLLLAVVFYATALLVLTNQPQLQTICWKLGHLTIASWTGFWIDRRAFYQNPITHYSDPLLQLRRAIIIAASMLAVGLGL